MCMKLYQPMVDYMTVTVSDMNVKGNCVAAFLVYFGGGVTLALEYMN